jgi:hypothetical protein
LPATNPDRAMRDLFLIRHGATGDVVSAIHATKAGAFA